MDNQLSEFVARILRDGPRALDAAEVALLEAYLPTDATGPAPPSLWGHVRRNVFRWARWFGHNGPALRDQVPAAEGSGMAFLTRAYDRAELLAWARPRLAHVDPDLAAFAMLIAGYAALEELVPAIAERVEGALASSDAGGPMQVLLHNGLAALVMLDEHRAAQLGMQLLASYVPDAADGDDDDDEDDEDDEDEDEDDDDDDDDTDDDTENASKGASEQLYLVAQLACILGEAHLEPAQLVKALSVPWSFRLFTLFPKVYLRAARAGLDLLEPLEQIIEQQDIDAELGLAVADALLELHFDARARPLFAACAQHPSDNLRGAMALRAFTRPLPWEVPELIEQRTQEGNVYVRACLSAALLALTGDARNDWMGVVGAAQAEEQWRAHLASEDKGDQLGAIWASVLFTDREPLRPLLNHKDKEVQAAAQELVAAEHGAEPLVEILFTDHWRDDSWSDGNYWLWLLSVDALQHRALPLPPYAIENHLFDGSWIVWERNQVDQTIAFYRQQPWRAGRWLNRDLYARARLARIHLAGLIEDAALDDALRTTLETTSSFDDLCAAYLELVANHGKLSPCGRVLRTLLDPTAPAPAWAPNEREALRALAMRGDSRVQRLTVGALAGLGEAAEPLLKRFLFSTSVELAEATAERLRDLTPRDTCLKEAAALLAGEGAAVKKHAVDLLFCPAPSIRRQLCAQWQALPLDADAAASMRLALARHPECDVE